MRTTQEYGTSEQTKLARGLVREAMLKIRSETPPLNHDSKRAITVQMRTDLLDGAIANRLIIHLHSRGCGWARETGGCTMCGFYAATSAGTPISSEDYLEQVSAELSRHSPQDFPIIGLYNAGNILNETEIPFTALEQICIRLSENPYIKRVSFESKLEYLDGKKLNRISAILSNKELEIGIGVETFNEKIRDLCINKPFSNSLLRKKVDFLLRLGVIPKAYILLNPPFLTVREAIDDLINSFIQLKSMGVERVNCETMTIEKHTLVYELWRKKYYRAPWLWSIISILTRLNGTRLYFTPFEYIVDAVATAHNCDRCSGVIKNRIFEFQDDKITLDELARENCACKEEWLRELDQKDERPIENRIIDILSPKPYHSDRFSDQEPANFDTL